MKTPLNPRRRAALTGCLAVGLLATGRSTTAQDRPPQSPQLPELQAQPLDSGPLHEAFAAPVSLGDSQPLIVFEEPPADVDEIPPDVQPEGRNVQWISGYWTWLDDQLTDADGGEYVWVSGLWRDVPQGRAWVPGVWSPVTAEGRDAFQWTPGYWLDEAAANEEVVYLPAPPPSLERGPNTQPPAADSFWVPGCWVYQTPQQDYSWRPGYWHQRPENFVWVPSAYQPTPRGYVFVPGYWDYPVARRGLPLAPVRFTNFDRRGSVFGGRRFAGTFRPQSVIRPALLTTALFVSRDRPRYFYGNYFGGRAANVGLLPLYQTPRLGGGFYDPIYNDLAWRGRRDNRDWQRDYERRFLQREQDYLNSDRAGAAQLVGDLQTLRAGGGLGDVVLNRIQRERYERFVDDRLQRLDEREQRRRSLTEAGDRDGRDREERTVAKPVLPQQQPGREDADPRPDRPGDANDTTPGAGDGTPRMTDRRPRRQEADRPVADRPADANPADAPPETDRPNADAPAAGRMRAEDPAEAPSEPRGEAPADRPRPDAPNADRPNADRPGVDRPSADRPPADAPRPDAPPMRSPRPGEPTADAPSADRPADAPRERTTNRPMTPRRPVGLPRTGRVRTSRGLTRPRPPGRQ